MMNYRYFIELHFNGKNYHGWQIQPNAHTIQGELNEKLSIILKRTIETVGAGRTDAGVHARYFVAHFDTEKSLKNINTLVVKLNSFLPGDICIKNIYPVNKNYHARFDVISRTYKYFISTQKDIFHQDYAWQIYYDLDIDRMNKGAKELMKYSDFTSFSKLHTDVKTNNCKVLSAHWTREENQLIFTITADRFLRNMVRSIVGTFADLGRRKTGIRELKKIIDARNRSFAGESAPAHGLFLYNIEYPYPLGQNIV